MSKRGEVNTHELRGIYVISSAYPQKNERRVGRSVVFPEAVVQGQALNWCYVAGGSQDKYASHLGLHVRTSLVKCIQVGFKQIQISTHNGSQYVFTKVMT